MAGRLSLFLLDTNVWLERLLEQEQFAEVRQFLDATETGSYSIHGFYQMNFVGRASPTPP